MCLILLANQMHPKYSLVLAANRDEYFDRPTAPLAFWDDRPEILAGRDLKRNGVWLGITRNGRIAAITNFRVPFLNIKDAPSRGLLVSDFLAGQESPTTYLARLKNIGQRYNGFNLLVGDRSGLFYYSNQGDQVEKVKPGVHGLSNHLLNTPWPKVEKGKLALENLVNNRKVVKLEDVFQILGDKSYPPDELLPDTGVGLDWERVLSPLFIISEFYGTRSSSVVMIERSGKVTFAERTFRPETTIGAQNQTRKFSFMVET